MSLIIVFTNDRSGTDDAANYHVRVFVNDRQIDSGRVEGHPRAESWRALVRRLADSPPPEPWEES